MKGVAVALRMLGYGMVAGLAFLTAMAVIEYLIRPGGQGAGAGTVVEAEASDQVWQVLAEARRILEESA